MPIPNLPYQLGKTIQVGNKTVHLRTVFSQRLPTATQLLLQQAINRADAALTHSITRAALRAPQLRNGSFVLGPFDPVLGSPTLANFANNFLMFFRLDEAHPDIVADYMDIYRNACLTVQRNLQGPLDLVDLPLMKQGINLCGYVRSYKAGGQVVRRGSIHIDLERITPTSIDETANTLIHEASHKFVLAKDHAYRHESQNGQTLPRAMQWITQTASPVLPSRRSRAIYSDRSKVYPLLRRVTQTPPTELCWCHSLVLNPLKKKLLPSPTPGILK